MISIKSNRMVILTLTLLDMILELFFVFDLSLIIYITIAGLSL